LSGASPRRSGQLPAAPELGQLPAAPELGQLPAAPELGQLPAAPELGQLPAAPELARVQRWMQAVITHPDGVAEGVASAGACAALDLHAGQLRLEGVAGGSSWPSEELEGVVRGSPRLPAHERLALYSRDYHLRLLDCLRSSHPALRELLGEELFDAFALDYLRVCPPHSYTLGELGSGFAHHLDRTRPADAEWATLIVELARVERAFAEVYDGPGVEGERIIGLDALACKPAAWWLQARLEPVPCLRLMRSRFPVGSYLSAVRGGGQPATPRARESFIALCRANWVVTVTELGAHEHDALRQLVAGRALGDLDERQAWEWLRGWVAAGFLRGVR
jgi:hypothetical protein